MPLRAPTPFLWPTHRYVAGVAGGRKGVAVALSPDEAVYYHGEVSLTVLAGSVSVFGTAITPTSPRGGEQPLRLYSPEQCSARGIQAKTTDKNVLVNEWREVWKSAVEKVTAGKRMTVDDWTHQEDIPSELAAIVFIQELLASEEEDEREEEEEEGKDERKRAKRRKIGTGDDDKILQQAEETSSIENICLLCWLRSWKKGVLYTTGGNGGEDEVICSRKTVKRSLVRPIPDPVKEIEGVVASGVHDSTPFVPLILSQEWSNIVRIVKSDPSASAAPIVLVMGSKGLGKSTFSQFVLDAFLDKYNEVGYLDTDLGQADFTPSGLISLHLVTMKTFGSSFSAQRIAKHSRFIGANSPKSVPFQYMAGIRSLWEDYTRLYQSRGSRASHADMVPLVVNTHGWVQALGYELLLQVIAMIRPNHIVHMVEEGQEEGSGGKEQPNVGEDVVRFIDLCGSGSFTERLDWASDQNQKRRIPVQSDYSPSVYRISSRVVKIPSAPSQAASSSRDLRLELYFQTNEIPLYQQVPYCVPWRALGVVCVHPVPPEHILATLNVSLVGLCVSDSSLSLSQQHANTPTILLPSARETSNCVGLGVVRGLDPEAGVLYLITPVPFHVLQKVNVLALGSVKLPPSMIACGQEYEWEAVPYLVDENDMLSRQHGGRPVKTRANLERKRHGR
mgnify:CR=1 FL=1